MNPFLSLINRKIKENCPVVPEELNFTLWGDMDTCNFIQLWFRTRGCRFNHAGGCTVCDYWKGENVSARNMVKAVEEALSNINGNPKILLLNASGSVLDDWEVPFKTRNKIFELLSRYQNTYFILETHYHTISRKNIKKCKSILNKNKIAIEVGLESSNPWILQNCINKELNIPGFMKKMKLLLDYGIDSIANVLVGIPFLSVREMIEDSVKTIQWLIDIGIKKCVVFPVNIKEWTLVYWMEKHNLYIQPSLWAYIEVLTRIPESFLKSIELAWYTGRPQFHPGYHTPIIAPRTCPECYDRIIGLLHKFSGSNEREEIIYMLKQINCECRERFKRETETASHVSLKERVFGAYKKIGEGVMGKDWWQKNKKLAVKSLEL